MTVSTFFTRAWLIRFLIAVVAGCALYWCIDVAREKIRLDSLAPVSLSGVHHLGEKFNVYHFYVDRHIGGSVGREGEGGDTCCVLLPKKWRPGLSVELRWSINDWTNENRAEIEAGNYRSVAGAGMDYIARVPVERYEVAEHVWVHFFTGGKVRVVSSISGAGGPRHPIQGDDPHAINIATTGRPVDALFSAKELAQMKREDSERKKTYGDWR